MNLFWFVHGLVNLQAMIFWSNGVMIIKKLQPTRQDFKPIKAFEKIKD